MHSEGLDISGNHAAMGITQDDFDMNEDDEYYEEAQDRSNFSTSVVVPTAPSMH